ncbi:MAG: hypothetical protein KME18_08190 [Phormidium tanganyikae FI6-MK23]|jgi:hypothetical protein|nr:hypothetical protein [Phormidium tanganyikae FI6-MK23]
MTPEEIQRTIEQMLAVQRELQNSQLRQREEIDSILPAIERMLEVQRELQNSQLGQREDIDE